MASFMGGFNCLRSAEPSQRDSLLLTSKYPGISGTHFIDLGRMKGWVDLGATYFEPVTPMLTKEILKIVELIWVTLFKCFKDEYMFSLKGYFSQKLQTDPPPHYFHPTIQHKRFRGLKPQVFWPKSDRIIMIKIFAAYKTLSKWTR